MLELYFSWSSRKTPSLTSTLTSLTQLWMRLKGVAIPQDISLMPTPSAINKLTITRIQVRLPGDKEEEGDQAEGEPMDTETEVAGQSSSLRGRGKRSRASSSSAVPPDAFQIIIERIDGLRDVQNEHFDRLAEIQD